MRITPLPEFQAEALLPATDFAMVEALLRAEAREHGLDLHEGHGRSIWCQVQTGEFGAKKRGEAVLVFARAHRPADLHDLQDLIAQHLAEILPEQAAAMRWSSLDDVGQLPPSFSLARVGSIRRIGRDFLRLRLHGDNLARLATSDSLHFRLVLPAEGNQAPEWPRIAANGQTVWPSGAQALHRPVYTVRAIDPAAGWLDTDIFLHPGGRVTDWALAGPEGRQIGLSGPNGGGIPTAAELVLAGDETAYPALARIIESRPDARGQLWLLGASDDYPFPEAPGLLRHHLPQGAAALAARLRADPPPAEAFLWMATEKSQIAALRGALLDEPDHGRATLGGSSPAGTPASLGHDRHRSHLAAYWNG